MCTIKLEWQTVGSKEIHAIGIAPDQYFDPVEAGETFAEHGIPKHDYPIDYLSLSSRKVSWITLIVSGTTDDFSQKTIYYGKGSSLLNHRVCKSGYEEIIVETTLPNNCTHLVRIHKTDSNFFEQNTNLFTENSGSMQERHFSSQLGLYLDEIEERY